MARKRPKLVSFKEFIGGVNSVAKTVTAPSLAMAKGVGKVGKGIGTASSNLMLPLMIGGGVVLLVLLRK
jgi:hypothetical protein